jgi:hypothetical protein
VLIRHTALVDEELAKLKSKVQRLCHLNASGLGDEVAGERDPDGESVSNIFLPVLEALTIRLMATRQVLQLLCLRH